MRSNYDVCELAKKVRATAAATIQNESLVVQNNERRVREATDIINLCNMILQDAPTTQIGSQWDR